MIFENLKQLGWGDYEARAYTALLQHYPASGYRVAKEANVPVAKIYEALARLVERGAIRAVPVSEGRTAQYVPVPPAEVLAGIRARHAQMLDELERDLTLWQRGSEETEAAQWLSGLTPILGRVHTLISSARKAVAIAAVPSWETGLRGALEAAEAHRVRLDRVVLAPDAGTRRETRASLSEILILVVDGEEALVAQRRPATEDATAFVTRSSLLVGLCADYVRLRRAVALVPEAVARLNRQDGWLDWEESKQRRLLSTVRNTSERAGVERATTRSTPQ